MTDTCQRVTTELCCVDCDWSTRTPFPACLDELEVHEPFCEGVRHAAHA